MNRKITILAMMVVFGFYLLPAQETRLEPNTRLTIKPGATLDIKSGDLVIRSDASGDASLIDYGNITYSGGGQAHVQRHLTEGQWHLVSSPVDNSVTGMFVGDYFQNHAENDNGWTDIVSESYPLDVMKGYALWSVDPGPTTEVFSGSTNTGSLNFTFTQSGLGWNLLGNPYPSALDWDAVTLPAELNGAIWLFDPGIGANGDYVYYINGGGAGNTATSYIPSGQGFFVRATGGPGTLTFDNSHRIHSGQDFYKNSIEEMLVLKVTGNNVTTQTAIRFNENATQQPDRLFDVFKIISDKPDVPNLYTRSDNETMAINSLPSIKGNEIVPMWFNAGMNGNYTIKATQMETFDYQTPIYIEDIATGTIQNMRDLPEYHFDYKSGEDRSFLVYFIEPDKSGHSSEINIYAYTNELHINFPVSEIANPKFNAQIMVFDITGRLVQTVRTSEIHNQIPLNGHHIIYMVRVISGDQITNAKVFIK
jgi:hypothetical protein